MKNELIICIVIVVIIILGNNITQGYASNSIEEITGKLLVLRNELLKNEDEIDNEYNYQEINQIYDNWKNRYDKLAYFIEHNELEKVETNLTSVKSFIETKSFTEAVAELDRCVFVMNHIEDKYAFNLQNIF